MDLQKIVLDFWSQVSIPDNFEGCWEWTGTVQSKGYGLFFNRELAREFFGLKSSQIYAHRMSYFLGTNQYPGALLCCHKCNRPICCNPGHIYLGSYLDNARDAVEAGTLTKGTDIHCSKLTEQDVRDIRANSEHETMPKLAEKYNVAYRTIRKVVSRRNWKHVA